MFHLPVELQRQCVEEANFKTLKALRLVDKATSILASELLFHTINLFPTDESAAKFSNILKDSTLNSLVRRAIFNTSLDPEADTRNKRESRVSDSFRDSINSVSGFPNFREVELKFSYECMSENDYYTVAESEEFRVAVLEIFFEAIRNAAKVDTLTIQNIHDATDGDICETENFKIVCSRLKKLNIQVATEYDHHAPDNSRGLAVGNDFSHNVLAKADSGTTHTRHDLQWRVLLGNLSSVQLRRPFPEAQITLSWQLYHCIQ
jgi:hypothetical protein